LGLATPSSQAGALLVSLETGVFLETLGLEVVVSSLEAVILSLETLLLGLEIVLLGLETLVLDIIALLAPANP
jgi:hypothetical protein